MLLLLLLLATAVSLCVCCCSYTEDKGSYLADRAAGLYAPSAYYAAKVSLSLGSAGVLVLNYACSITSALWCCQSSMRLALTAPRACLPC